MSESEKTLEEKCLEIYEADGQDAVIKHCDQIGWKQWGTCEPCEYDLSPIKDGTCLVCGSPATVVEGRKPKTVLTLRGALDQVMEQLEDELEENDELRGAMNTLQAMIDADKGSFDGMVTYAVSDIGKVIIAVELN